MLTVDETEDAITAGRIEGDVELAFTDLWEFDEGCTLDDFCQLLNDKLVGVNGPAISDMRHRIIGDKDGKAIIRVSGEIEP